MSTIAICMSGKDKGKMSLEGYFNKSDLAELVENWDKYQIISVPVDSGDHLGCPSYPNCDLSPQGCLESAIGEVDWYGHKD